MKYITILDYCLGEVETYLLNGEEPEELIEHLGFDFDNIEYMTHDNEPKQY